ncbi:peptidylprolyl isomerase [Salinicoccus sp. ID82-1]|uniref:foldase protein PrsA n=1 Tax=Salinicoccus sp. ID82-1 TaxID=2820269 RepID=UPI001F441B4F|nr:peptidylprolyl isomerase [Salinicoccus sp. ID82-1]MCG1009437.1 peptidylprolyl isomerase [Salinicoccus sp. ID82-1]
MKKKLAPIVVGLGLVGLAGCGNDSSSDSAAENETEFGNVLATSDAGDVTTDDILNELGTDNIANRTFQLTLDTILQDKYSDAVDREEIEAQINEEIEAMGGEDQFAAVLQQQQPGMTVETYKEQRINNAYHDAFFAEKFEVTDEEEAMESVREASHILIQTSDEEGGLSDAEAKEKAESLLQEIEDGRDFGEVATEESDDTGSAQNNGELGYVQRGQMVEPFEEALFNLEKGEVSDVVESEFGYHIIKRHQEENIDEELDAIKRQIVSTRIQENQEQVLGFYNDLLEEYNAEFENEEIRTYIEETYLNTDSEASTEEGSTEGSTEEASSEEESAEESTEEETTEEASAEESTEETSSEE